MSVREYIGARYVPVFADPIEWSSSTAYEPLTIVTYQGNTYTSRQAVPVGIPITNSAFWALTANYNAQVEAYRTEVRQLSDRVDDFDTELDALDTRVDALEPLLTQQLILIGDSWLAPDTGRTLAVKIKDKLHVDDSHFFNYAVRGTGFVRASDNSFPNQLAAIINNRSIDKTLPTTIVVLGGTNDYTGGFTTASAYVNAINGMQTAINSNFTRAKTVFFFMQAALNRIYPYSLIKGVIDGTADTCTVVNAYWPVPKTDFEDNLHLNEAGNDKMCRFILANLGIGTYSSVSEAVRIQTIANTQLGDYFNVFAVRQEWNDVRALTRLYVTTKSVVAANTINGQITGITLPCPIHGSASPNGDLNTFNADTPVFKFVVGTTTISDVVTDNVQLRNPVQTGITYYSGDIIEIATT